MHQLPPEKVASEKPWAVGHCQSASLACAVSPSLLRLHGFLFESAFLNKEGASQKQAKCSGKQGTEAEGIGLVCFGIQCFLTQQNMFFQLTLSCVSWRGRRGNGEVGGGNGLTWNLDAARPPWAKQCFFISLQDGRQDVLSKRTGCPSSLPSTNTFHN